MHFIFQDSLIVEKKESNINGLNYIPSILQEGLNDRDSVFKFKSEPPPLEISDCNIFSLEKILNELVVRNIVEIGVSRNGSRSFTHTLLKRKTKNGIYCGIDLDDKSYLNNINNNIYTIQTSSYEQTKIRDYLKKIGIKEIDVLFIDGDHSINTVVNDWKYTDLLSKNSVVILHDTNHHLGPTLLMDAIDQSKFAVYKYCQLDNDYGLSAAFKL